MKLKAVFLLTCIWILLCGFAPSGGYWLDVTTSELGAVRIYVSSTYAQGAFALEDGKPVNMTTSNISGAILNSSGDRAYTVTAAPYGEDWTYRQQGTGYSSSTLTVTGIDQDTSTVQLIGMSVAPELQLDYIVIFLIGALIVLIWSRR